MVLAEIWFSTSLDGNGVWLHYDVWYITNLKHFMVRSPNCSWFIHFLLLIKLFLISLTQSSSLLVFTDIVNFSVHTKVSINIFSKLSPKVLLNYKKLNYFYFLHYFLELPYTSILDPPWDCLEEICIEVIAQRSSTKKVFSEFVQNSLVNNCPGVSRLKTFFIEHQTAASIYCQASINLEKSFLVCDLMPICLIWLY